MSDDLKSKFDRCFKAEFPATFEAAQRGEPKPHGDMSNAWWGFRTGYHHVAPTKDQIIVRKSNRLILPLFMVAAWIIGAMSGYKFPRDVELESLKPVEFRYEITADAAKYLLLKDGPKCEVKP